MNAAARLSSIKRQLNRHRRQTLGEQAILLLLSAGGDGEPVKQLVTDWSMQTSGGRAQQAFLVVPPDDDFNSLFRDTVKPRLMVKNSNSPALNDVNFRLTDETRPPYGATPYWRLAAEQEEA